MKRIGRRTVRGKILAFMLAGASVFAFGSVGAEEGPPCGGEVKGCVMPGFGGIPIYLCYDVHPNKGENDCKNGGVISLKG